MFWVCLGVIRRFNYCPKRGQMPPMFNATHGSSYGFVIWDNGASCRYWEGSKAWAITIYPFAIALYYCWRYLFLIQAITIYPFTTPCSNFNLVGGQSVALILLPICQIVMYTVLMSIMIILWIQQTTDKGHLLEPKVMEVSHFTKEARWS